MLTNMLTPCIQRSKELDDCYSCGPYQAVYCNDDEKAFSHRAEITGLSEIKHF